MNEIGFYFGPNSIDITAVNGKNLVSNLHIPQSASQEPSLEDKVTVEQKLIELVALIQGELRKHKLEAKEAVICLSGSDLLIRTFEIPLVPAAEISNAVFYEVKKYIPFKIEDLVCDFQVAKDPSGRSNQVLFMGMKRNVLLRYLSIFEQLKVEVKSIEYCGFSALRSMKMIGTPQKGVFGMLIADKSGGDEINFVVSENGYPLFSRDITLSKAPASFEEDDEADSGLLTEKLKTEIRISLDYYNRMFPTKAVQKVFLCCTPELQQELETFMKEIGILAQGVDMSKLLGKNIVFSSGLLKSYSISLNKAVKTGVKVDLMIAHERERLKSTVKGKTTQIDVATLFKGFKLDPRVLLPAVVLCAGIYGLRFVRLQPIEQEVTSLKSSRLEVKGVNPDSTYEELTASVEEYKRKLKALEKVIVNESRLTEVLNIIPRVLPEGVWLTNFSFQRESAGSSQPAEEDTTRNREDNLELILKGAAYLKDGNLEMAAVNEFVTRLKEAALFSAMFKEINIGSIDRSSGRNESKMGTTVFTLSCKSSRKKGRMQ
ncbi:MAG: pilus assembly protein PilM [Candidatus Omnitrophica bacterium]|nr:pilus assembly protein PilM [Candidatus Omnitrophota bacterium]